MVTTSCKGITTTEDSTYINMQQCSQPAAEVIITTWVSFGNPISKLPQSTCSYVHHFQCLTFKKNF